MVRHQKPCRTGMINTNNVQGQKEEWVTPILRSMHKGGGESTITTPTTTTIPWSLPVNQNPSSVANEEGKNDPNPLDAPVHARVVDCDVPCRPADPEIERKSPHGCHHRPWPPVLLNQDKKVWNTNWHWTPCKRVNTTSRTTKITSTTTKKHKKTTVVQEGTIDLNRRRSGAEEKEEGKKKVVTMLFPVSCDPKRKRTMVKSWAKWKPKWPAKKSKPSVLHHPPTMKKSKNCIVTIGTKNKPKSTTVTERLPSCHPWTVMLNWAKRGVFVPRLALSTCPPPGHTAKTTNLATAKTHLSKPTEGKVYWPKSHTSLGWATVVMAPSISAKNTRCTGSVTPTSSVPTVVFARWSRGAGTTWLKKCTITN